MKKFHGKYVFILVVFLLSINLFSRAPGYKHFRAMAYDSRGELIQDQNISLRITIHGKNEKIKIIYQEVQVVKTDHSGVFTISIGKGRILYGEFSSIVWNEIDHQKQIEFKLESSNSSLKTNLNQLLSAPRFLFMKNLSNVLNPGAFKNDTLNLGNLFLITPGLNIDIVPVQVRLLKGETPIQIFKSGIPLDSLYGQIWMGGLIFYMDTITGSGLVCATEDQPFAKWGYFETPICGAYYSAIGSGKVNTEAILYNNNNSVIAATICYKYRSNENNKWFLPSKDELDLIQKNLKQKGIGGFSPVYYWSSTESGENVAWGQFFYDGTQGTFGKNYSFAVRPVSEF